MGLEIVVTILLISVGLKISLRVSDYADSESSLTIENERKVTDNRQTEILSEIFPNCTFDRSGGCFGCCFGIRCPNLKMMQSSGDIRLLP